MKKMSGNDSQYINKLQFRNLVQAFTKTITDTQSNEIFNLLTRRPEDSRPKSSMKSKENVNGMNQDIDPNASNGRRSALSTALGAKKGGKPTSFN